LPTTSERHLGLFLQSCKHAMHRCINKMQQLQIRLILRRLSLLQPLLPPLPTPPHFVLQMLSALT